MDLKALLIGCGNIGAQYDLDNPNRVWTHAKAYSLINGIELTIMDTDSDKANKISNIYKARIINDLNEKEFENFDVISITTPTTTHFKYLRDALRYSSAVIICEKPVVASLAEVNEIMNVYTSSGSRVLVNYLRRFQPAFQTMREKLKAQFEKSLLTGIIIKYTRGFLNNAGHAVDLLEYLYDEPFDFKGLLIQKFDFDSFSYDPTLTGTCLYMDKPVNFAGVSNVTYPIFEIEIFYKSAKILIFQSGDEIRYYTVNENGLQEDHSVRQNNILEKYMVPVIADAINLYKKSKSDDNFMQALMINKRMLEIIETLKIKNVTASN
jgi:predicted dehydrogenase